MAATGTAQLTNIVNAIRAKATFLMQDYGVFPGVFDRVKVPSGNRSYTEPKITAVTAYDLTEAVDMTNAQQLTDSLLTVSPTEVGVQVIYTRMAAETRSESVIALITRAITDALKKKQDTDGTLQLDNFSTSLGSGSGTTLTVGYLNAARARVRGNPTEPDKSALVCVVHDYTYNDLADTIGVYQAVGTDAGPLNVGLAGLPEQVARNYEVGRLAGMPIYTDSNIAIASNAAKGGVFSKRAVVYAELWGIDIEPEKDASLRGTEINGTMCYAYGERIDTSGIELNLGATAPTA